jgi:hypothetical protein
MIARLVMWVSTLASLALIASFVMFASDQARDGTDQQVAKIGSATQVAGDAKGNVNQADPSPRTEREREKRHGDVREGIDDVNDVLVAPFTSLAHSDQIWVQRGVPSLLALIVFGLGLRLLAAYLPGGGRR